MKTLEFLLIIILVVVICIMAVFTRWHISIDECKNNKTVAESVPTSSQYDDLPITRIEFLAILSKKIGLEEYGPVTFTDINKDSSNVRYIYPLLKMGIISGYTDNTFRPNDIISKNEAEIIIARALKRPTPTSYSKGPYLTKKQMDNLLSELVD
ncbi:MAG TPA: hypothetical protein DCK76_02325 [Desulfotomaculum sp.]|nr:MAG: BglA2 [Desulfotomaculum sp. 46_80]HAG10235.1 hypothetical protein [Desulfotomaculum sp.]HBY04283.1 hypothetical protein [Desulfotomaculum sp.]